MQIQLDWFERQFRIMGRRDSYDLAIELLVGYQGSAVLTNALGQPQLMARQARHLEKWMHCARNAVACTAYPFTIGDNTISSIHAR